MKFGMEIANNLDGNMYYVSIQIIRYTYITPVKLTLPMG